MRVLLLDLADHYLLLALFFLTLAMSRVTTFLEFLETWKYRQGI